MQQFQDLLIDALLDQGFTLPEAERLVTLQAHMEGNRRREQQQLECSYWLEHNRQNDADKNS
jgi:hypothetical protein